MTEIAFKKTPFGLMPADKATHKLISGMKEGETIRAKVIEDDRTTAQHRLFFMWLTDISKQTGHTKEDLHLQAKHKYAVPIFKREYPEWDALISHAESGGPDVYWKFLDHCVHTSELSVKEYAEMLTEIDSSATTKGLTLRYPDELYRKALDQEAERAA